MGVHREGNLWRVQVQIKGRRTSTTARTAEDARAIEARIRRDHALSRAGLPPQRSLEDALTRWLDEYVPQLKRGRDYESHLRALAPHAAGIAIDEAPEAWRRYLAGNPDLTNSTHNRRGAVLRRVANLAHRWGWCGPGIADRVELRPENPARHIYLTPADVARLMKACHHAPTRDAIAIAAWSGLRLGEILRLQPADIARSCIHVRESKTGKPRLVPVHPSIRGALARLPIPCGARWLTRHFELARAALGHPEWHFHDLRHTNASWLIAAGADLVTVRDLLGHSSLAVTGRYTHLQTGHLRAAVRRLKAR